MVFFSYCYVLDPAIFFSYHDISTRDTRLPNIEGRPVRVCFRADLLTFWYPVNIRDAKP